MGDFSAKVGGDNTVGEEVMSRHGEGIMNENSELFGDIYVCIYALLPPRIPRSLGDSNVLKDRL